MEVKVLEMDDSQVKISLKGIYRAYANALRRFAIAEVPCMAIDEVVILENSSVMYDEVLAYRLGMLPLRTDLDRYLLPDECDCKSALGCSKCRVLVALDAEAKDLPKTVLSGDLVSEDREIRPTSDKVPIVKLAPGQKVKLEAYAKLGKGREHAKWQPVTVSVLKTADGRSDEFILHLESVGSLKASEIFLKAIEILHKKLEEFEGTAKELGKSK